MRKSEQYNFWPYTQETDVLDHTRSMEMTKKDGLDTQVSSARHMYFDKLNVFPLSLSLIYVCVCTC